VSRSASWRHNVRRTLTLNVETGDQQSP